MAIGVIVLSLAWIGVAIWVGRKRRASRVPPLDETRRASQIVRVPTWKAIQHVAIRCIGEAKDGNNFPRARDEIRRAAINGDVTIWGKKQIMSWAVGQTTFESYLTEIPSGYWKTHKISAMAADESLNLNYASTVPIGSGATFAYADLHIRESQISEFWPVTFKS